MTILGDRVRECRKRVGLSQAALAKKLEISRGAMAGWEQGRTSPIPLNEDLLREVIGLETPLSIGEWLRRAREEANVNQQELARNSGISLATIRIIEMGNSENPTKSTMTKLQKALRRFVPDEIVKASNEESEIEGIGILTDFIPAETANAEWPNVAGVYALYDVSKRPIYIGQSQIIATRLRQHLE